MRLFYRGVVVVSGGGGGGGRRAFDGKSSGTEGDVYREEVSVGKREAGEGDKRGQKKGQKMIGKFQRGDDVGF